MILKLGIGIYQLKKKTKKNTVKNGKDKKKLMSAFLTTPVNIRKTITLGKFLRFVIFPDLKFLLIDINTSIALKYFFRVLELLRFHVFIVMPHVKNTLPLQRSFSVNISRIHN